jgi:hypothetical protein
VKIQQLIVLFALILGGERLLDLNRANAQEPPRRPTFAAGPLPFSDRCSQRVDRRNPCLASGTIGENRSSSACYNAWRSLAEASTEFREFQQEGAEAVQSRAQQVVGSGDADRGAQCALQSTLARAEESEQTVRFNLDQITSSLKRVNEYVEAKQSLIDMLSNAIRRLRQLQGCVGNQQPTTELVARCHRAAYANESNIQIRGMVREHAATSREDESIIRNTLRLDPRILLRQSEMVQRKLSQAKEELECLKQSRLGIQKIVDERRTAIPERIASLQARRAQITERYRCTDPSTAEAPQRLRPPKGDVTPSGTGEGEGDKALSELREHTTRMRSPTNGPGATGFYATTVGPDGVSRTHLVTAVHVGAENFFDTHNLNQADLSVSTAARLPTEGSDLFRPQIEPQLYDKGNDVMIRPTGNEHGGMLVAPAGATPTMNQEFLMGGHPGIQGSEFTYMRCQFQGYEGATGKYVMNCPTGNRFIGGMSGGPVVDAQTGQAWGVITQQGAIGTIRDDRVFVTPISNGNNGTIVIGQQGNFLSDNCFRVIGNERYRCQVLPNGFSESMP